MTNKVWKTAGALALGMMCFSGANLDAQVSKTLRSNGAVVSSTTPKANPEVPAAEPAVEDALPAGASVIYSNFGAKIPYNPQTGWTEAGIEANDEAIAEAMSFIPTSDYIVIRIDAAFTYVQGVNGVKMILAEDNGGVPGKPIYSATFANLPTFGTCCAIQTAKLSPSKGKAVALKAGQTYWVYPLPVDTSTYLVWNYDVTNLGGPGAVSHDYGQTWSSTTLQPFGSFDLYGIQAAQ